MLDFLRWLLNQRELSKDEERTGDIARQRLQLVLIQDRLDLPADKMEAMKEEFKEMGKRRKVTELWVRPLLAKFEELYTSHASV